MTRANIAGLSRLLLIFPAGYFILEVPIYGRIAATVVVIIAIITDILDGVFARKDETLSSFGVFLDLTADKMFLCPLLFLISFENKIIVWLAIIVTGREFLVMGIRAYLAAERIVLPAMALGKAKSIIMYPAVILVLLNIQGAIWVLGLSVLVAVISAADYIRMAWPTLRLGMFPKVIHKVGGTRD